LNGEFASFGERQIDWSHPEGSSDRNPATILRVETVREQGVENRYN
jgi:hypothetical protein